MAYQTETAYTFDKSLKTGKFAYLIALSFSLNCTAAPLEASIAQLRHELTKVNYHTHQHDCEAKLEKMSTQAHQLSSSYPGRAEPLIIEGIIDSTLAQYQSIFSARSTATAARDLLMRAEKIAPNAMEGSALTALGVLYYRVPSFGSFGDDNKAREYLERALKVNPNGIDQNYYYAHFLFTLGKYAESLNYLKKAQNATPRPGYEDADAGRQAEIRQAIAFLEEKLKVQ